ncbi:MAG: hypothetical protein WAK01_04375 [Methylocystis sp.]
MIANLSAQFYVHLVEIDQNPIGIVTQSDDGYRFLAFNNTFACLEASLFDDADEACSAIIALERAKTGSEQQ